MPAVNDETGITNLGVIPEGMTFAAAIAAAKPQRKYTIDPYRKTELTRLTLCETLRALWREVDTLPDGPQKEQMREYLGAAFDFGKRMDARMKQLKAMLLAEK